MKTLRYMAAALAAAGLMAAPANATTFVFKGAGNNALPDGNSTPCATSTPLQDLCTVVAEDGFTYEKDGITVVATAYAGVSTIDDVTEDNATRLIQDLSPQDSGLGAWSETDSSADQTQFESAEAISFVFDTLVHLTNVEFNRGGDTSCTPYSDANPGEGPCGFFQLFVDGVDMGVVEATNLIASLGIGMSFVLIALDLDNEIAGGFTVAQFTVAEVPVPAALPLLLSGLAGLGFASRRRKTA
jgi:hypothetical protein